jgi:hypothetical protein
MSFVKIDCGIVNSSLWIERDARSLFLTALVMAEPFELRAPTPQLCTRSLDETGWLVPPGWYGFVPAAGVGILRCDGITDADFGFALLDKLAQPDPDSRSREYDGRRLVRINGGFIVLNYMTYRERDYTAADRSRRYRENKKQKRADAEAAPQLPLEPVVTGTPRDAVTPSRDVTRDITQAEAEAEAEAYLKQLPVQAHARPNGQTAAGAYYSDAFEAMWKRYPERDGGNPKKRAWQAWSRRIAEARGRTPTQDRLAAVAAEEQAMTDGVERYTLWLTARGKIGTEFVMQAATFFGPDAHYRNPYVVKLRPSTNGAGTTQRERNRAVLDKYIVQDHGGADHGN